MRYRNRVRRLALLIAISAALIAPPLRAQQAGQSQLVGTVTDLTGKPLAEVQVNISALKKATTTDAQGRYRIDGLKADSVLVLFRRIGSRLRSVSVQLVPGENQVNVELEEMPQRLDAAITKVEQTGVFGVIGDTAFNILVRAQVTLAGKNGDKLTDSTGAFFFDPVRPGANLLEVRARGFKPRIVSFDMAKKGGSKLAVWLTPLRLGLTDRQISRESDFDNFLKSDLAYFDRRQRWKTTKAGVSSREEMSRYAPHMSLGDAVQFLPSMTMKGIRAKSAGVGIIFCAVVDGIVRADPSGNILDWYTTDEVETLEIYPPNSEWSNSIASPGALSACTGPGATPRGPATRINRRLGASDASGLTVAVIILRR